jgi:copper chaperone CopZ
MATTRTVSVEGMTCNHCVGSVSKELMALSGVTNVAVDLEPTGLSRVTISADADIPESDLSEAISEAGYQMVGASE